MPDDIALLANLLSSANATPRISPQRIASSTVYDLEYRIAIIASGFVTLAVDKGQESGARRVRFAELKLAQFVAMRPWLLPVMREWKRAQANPQQSLLASERLRRGYLGDSMFDDTIDFFSAMGFARRVDQYVVADGEFHQLEAFVRAINDASLFERERKTLTAFCQIAVTASMLEGW